MNQIKIGKFIAECRKNKNLTQEELAEKLNLSNKTISKWENGKGMPDSGIMLELCDTLNINVNELLSGEKLNETNYQLKANENIVKIAKEVDKSKKIKNRTILIGIIILVILISYFILISLYNSFETVLKYDDRIMKCEITDDNIIFSIDRLSIANIYCEKINTNTETLYFITSKIYLINKSRSHWETWEGMAKLNNGENNSFSSKLLIDRKDNTGELKNNIKVYYTSIPLNKILKSNESELKNIIENSNLIGQI